MFIGYIKESKNSYQFYKKLLLISALTLGITYQSKLISQPLISTNLNDKSKYSNQSFITKAIEKTGGSVVTIETQRIVKQRTSSRDSRILIDPRFERFFGLQLPFENQPRVEQSQGSGFIFQDGLVMTNAHVIKGSDKVIVGLKNGKKLKGKVIGEDSFTDLAIVKIEGKDLGKKQNWEIHQLLESAIGL